MAFYCPVVNAVHPHLKRNINLNEPPEPVNFGTATNGLLDENSINVGSEDETPGIPQNPRDYSQTSTCMWFAV